MSRYLNLLEKCILDTLHGETPVSTGKWPRRAHSMVGSARMRNVRELAESVLKDGIEGDFVDAGTWRGGCAIMMSGVLEEHNDRERAVWVADSFEGLPRPELPQDDGLNLYMFPELAVSLEQVKRNFECYGLLTQRVKFLQGWFCDTLPTAPIEKISLLRADGDMWRSTMDILENLYPKLSVGGYVILDDMGDIPQCAGAVNDYRLRHNITEPIETIDWSGRFWRKER